MEGDNTMGDQDIGLDVENEPLIGKNFNSEKEAYEFYNSYGGRMGFSMRREYAHWSRADKSILTSRKFVCSKQGIRPKAIFDYMSKQAGGRENLGYTSQDHKNYLRTKRQRDLSYGESGSLLMYFERQTRKNPSFTYALQLDSEEKITNIFWDDPKMLIDYAQFGDVITFDTIFCTNKEYKPFDVFIGFNHHRGICIFGAALLYDETSESFKWLFKTFLEAHGQKKPLTIFTDQDAAMGKAISEEVLEFENAWQKLRSDYPVKDSSWLDRTYGLKEKRAKCFMKKTFTIGMRSTQLSESLNGDLKDYLKSSLDLVQFFKHFERVVNDKRYKELKAEFEFAWIIACNLKYRNESPAICEYIVAVVKREGDFNVMFHPVGPTIACSCRKFETFGILCCHAWKILDVLDIKFIPAPYVLRRWTWGAKNMIVERSDGVQVEEDVNLDYTQRYRLLCPKLVRIASDASNSSEGYSLVDRVANYLCAQLQNIVVDAPQMDVPNENYDVNIKRLKEREPRKGSKQWKSFMEKFGSKKKAVEIGTSQSSHLIQPSAPSHEGNWNPNGESQDMDNNNISFTSLLAGSVDYSQSSLLSSRPSKM
ncbi:protein FAR1-RELATED SEQUENCE 7-like [Telopea speciosissima]|uniref:protein FAR1-RELATED SEQUENCE 7-like n=1 Tax=Telopea speciosissima TaxID=54955 RepID=UPI001CC3E9D2|nr:protein FAR1-RELATED SEQUENCE 7-like [Telopea speciosissima]